MPILPIDMGRYGTPEMRKIFDEEEKLQRLLSVEAALAWAHAQVGHIPKKDGEKIVSLASVKYVKIEHVKEIENEIKHDIMAVVKALTEVCGSSGAYVHLGATSSDITDTATALQLKDAISIIRKRLILLEEILIKLAKENKQTLIVGRTHGQHAIPTTLGFKFSIWLREVARHIIRLDECSERVLVGKMSGAVGTQASLGSKARQVQQLTMKRLGIKAIDISTQIIPRDIYAELFCLFANLASSLDKFATEIRELQRPEINELAEPFNTVKQIGSSTMPHKKNPIYSERICGLAKIMRSLTIPAMENIPTWHERDLTQSSAERFIIPEACILLDYMLYLIVNILQGLHINKVKMRKNIDITQGRIMAESVMLNLTRRGMGRQAAHRLVREISLKCATTGKFFKDALLENSDIKKFLSKKEIETILDPAHYLGTALEQIDAIIEKTQKERKNKFESKDFINIDTLS